MGVALRTPDVLHKRLTRSSRLPCAIALIMKDGKRTVIGDGEPALSVHVNNARGFRALASLSNLEICEAYIRDDLDFEGDLIAASQFQQLLSDRQFGIKLWRRVKPLIFGREKVNPEWIALHYDMNNIQLMAADKRYHTYTPGTYASDDESLESGAHRKLENAFDFLRLQEGMTLLDVGCGWGGMVRFSARRGVSATGITLSKHQFGFVTDLVAKERLDVKVLYQDFFTFKPDQLFDAVSMMGVIEDLSDYPRVMRRLTELVKPGGRVYLDFASARNKFGTSSFITKYIWPGTFRMVPLPDLIDAITASPFEVKEIHNDRHNYHLWAKEMYRQWMELKSEVLKVANEQVWRTQRIMQAGTAGVMANPACGVNAYRMVIERRLC